MMSNLWPELHTPKKQALMGLVEGLTLGVRLDKDTPEVR